MAITFVSYAFGYDSAIDNTLVVAAPAGIQDGDILLITGYEDGGKTTSCTGFTLVDDVRLFILWKRASSESGSYTINFSANVEGKAALISVWRGCVAADSPIDVYSNTAYTTVDKTLRCYGVTTTVANAMLVAFGMYGGTNLSFTQPSGFTTVSSEWDAYWYENVPLAYLIQASAGASGNKDFTTTGDATGDKRGALIALKPAVTVATFTPNVLLL